MYIHGLFLEGGNWDGSKKVLCDPIKVKYFIIQNQLHCAMPVIQFIPIKVTDKKTTEKY